MSIKQIKEYIENKTNFPVRDRYDMPSSTKRFEGGAHYRMEITGIERAVNFETLVKEIDKQKVTIHRVIGTVGGSAFLDKAELKYYAQISADAKIETLVNCMASRAWDGGKQYASPEGYVSGMRLRGHDNIYLWLKEFDRCLNAGLRGFLITDESLLYLVTKMRADGVIPADTKFKVSVFAGHGNGIAAKMLEDMGADSFNPLADLSLPMLASIRSASNIPMDVYMSLVDSMGNIQRHVDSEEIARICAPVYFKFEPGKNECDIYNAWHDDEPLDKLVKLKVQMAKVCKEWCDESEHNLIFNDYKADLSIPRP
ncbi:MAG: hypothetical protein AB9844_06870 [Clostridiaceae bacterium]